MYIKREKYLSKAGDFFKKITALLLMLVMMLSMIPVYEQVSAADKAAKPGTSVITGEVLYNDSEKPEKICITISKTENASGYYIYLKSPGSAKFKKVKNLKKSGKKIQKYFINKPEAGDYQVSIMPYHTENGKTVKGKYSNTVKLCIKSGISKTGTDRADLECTGEKYPMLKKMAEEGQITLTASDSGYCRDTITFGKYKVDRYNASKDKTVSEKKERALEWEVLEYSDDAKSALVISKNIISVRKYAKKAKKYSWKNSDIRKWLNGEFLDAAFTKKEQELIKTVTVLNDDPGGDTSDKMYILNDDESDYYLVLGAIEDGYPDSIAGQLYDGTEWEWFLRDTYKEDSVLGYGSDGVLGYTSADDEAGIRPVFRIELTPELIWDNNLSCVKPAGNSLREKNIYVNLGKYDFPDSEGKTDGVEENIEWEILDYDEKNGTALLISRYLFHNELLDTQNDGSSSRWKYSLMRKWLKNIIYDQAFSDEEKALMSQITFHSEGTVDAEIETKDKLFIFSHYDVYDYYRSDVERIGLFIDGNAGPWALTSENYVGTDGQARRNFEESDIKYVRPVMYLNLNTEKDRVQEPDAPEYSVKSTINGAGLEINIEKTYLADGYYIYMKAPGKKKYEKVKKVAEDGSRNRYTVLRNLDAGDYSVYVKAYRNVDGKEILSENNNLNVIRLSGSEETEYLQSTYAKLKGLEDKGLIGLKINYEKDSIKLGKWPLPNSNEDESEAKTTNDLEWVVLDYSDDFKQALVCSKYIVGYDKYHKEDEVVTWENSSLRKWLNKNFYKKAFSKEEKSLIKVTKVKNEDNPKEKTSGGNDTEDRIFLLSISEAEKYFEDENWNPFKDGLYFDDYDIEWLRSPGRGPSDISEYWALDPEDRDEEFLEDWRLGYAAAYFGRGSGIYYEGPSVIEECGVRPAFWMELTPEIIEANNLTLSLDKTEWGHYNNPLVEFGSFTIKNPLNIEGKAEELTWELTEYDLENDRALLVCTSKLAKEDYENDFLNNAFNAEENSLIRDIYAYEEDSAGIRPAICITFNQSEVNQRDGSLIDS